MIEGHNTHVHINTRKTKQHKNAPCRDDHFLPRLVAHALAPFREHLPDPGAVGVGGLAHLFCDSVGFCICLLYIICVSS